MYGVRPAIWRGIGTFEETCLQLEREGPFPQIWLALQLTKNVTEHPTEDLGQSHIFWAIQSPPCLSVSSRGTQTYMRGGSDAPKVPIQTYENNTCC